MNGPRLTARPFLRVKRLTPFLIAAVSSLLAAGLIFLPDIEGAKSLVRDAGVWVVWGVCGLFVYGVYQAREVLMRQTWLDLRGSILVLAASGLVHVHYPHEFKVLSDELVLVGISRSIHEERQAAAPLALQDASGAVKISYGYLDKRPFFFPFVVALLHDLTGYRPANAFILNGLITPLFFYLVFLVGWQVTGRKGSGYVGVLMALAVPIYAHNFTGAGFEILNVVLILALFLWGLIYARTGAAEMQTGLVALGLMLAYTRYESALYLIAVVGMVATVQCAFRKVHLEPAVSATVVLAIPLGCIFRVVASQKEQFFQLGHRGTTEAFAWSYIPQNLPSALEFFFADDHVQMGSRWISFLCVAGVVTAGVVASRMLLRKQISLAGVAPLLVPFTVVVNMGVLLAYHWGQLSDPLVSRLAIPFITGAIVTTVWAASCAVNASKVTAALAVVAGFALYASAIPVATKHSFARAYGPGREVETIQMFMRQHDHPDTLVLTDRPLIWVCYGYWTESIGGALTGREKVEKWIRSGRYTAVFAVQKFDVEPETGATRLRDLFKVPVEWELQEVVRRRISDTEVFTISRIITASSAPTDDPSGEISSSEFPDDSPVTPALLQE